MSQPAPPPGGPPPAQQPPVSPPGVPYPPPGYAPYYPPPQRSRTLLIVVVVVVVLVVVTFVIAAVLYILVSGLITGPGANPPILVFSNAAVLAEPSGTIARFSVLASQNPAPASEFRERLSVNATQGSTTPLSPVATIQVGATQYTVTWTDADTDGRVSTSDVFDVSTAGGLPAGQSFVFTLTWSLGVSSNTWTVSWTT